MSKCHSVLDECSVCIRVTNLQCTADNTPDIMLSEAFLLSGFKRTSDDHAAPEHMKFGQHAFFLCVWLESVPDPKIRFCFLSEQNFRAFY